MFLVAVALGLITSLTTRISGLELRQETTAPTKTSQSHAVLSSSSASSSPSPSQTLEIDQSVDVTLDGKIFPPIILVDNVEIPKDFSVDCANCSVVGNLGLSAGGEFSVLDGFDSYTVPAPSNFFDLPPNYVFPEKWVGAAFEKFSAHFEFSINLTASSNSTNEFVVPLYQISKSKTIEKVVTFEALFSPEIHGWVNTTTDVNFTYGFDFEIQPGSGVLIDFSSIENVTQSLSIGFNQSTLTPIPFTSSTSDIAMGLELSLRPSVTFLVTVLGGAIASDSITTSFDVPKLDVNITQVKNVTSTCDPAPASLPADQVYSNLTNIVPSLGFDVLAVFTETEGTHENSQAFEPSWTAHNFTTACLGYDVAKKTLAAVPQSKPSGGATSVRASATGLLLALTLLIFATM